MNNLIKLVVVGLLVMGLSGCMTTLVLGAMATDSKGAGGGDYLSISEGDLLYKQWQKVGKTELDIKKALLECGESDVSGFGHVSADRGMGKNDIVLAYLCMQQAGYTPREPIGHCDNSPALPACQSGAVIPSPSVERRLQSYTCVKTPDSYLCQR